LNKNIFYCLCIFSLLIIFSLLTYARSEKNTAPDELISGVIEIDGLKRTYRVHLPQSYKKNNLYPLVLSLHGRFGNAKNQAKLSGFNEISERENFIVVYPEGAAVWKRGWSDGRGKIEVRGVLIDDVKFIIKLLDKIENEFSIDRSRIYACGMSNGGFMSMRLACKLSNRVAAVAAVGATFGEDLANECQPERAVPVLIITGTEDPLVLYQGGVVEQSDFNGRYFSAKDSILKWAEYNGCKKGPLKNDLPDTSNDGTTVVKIKYSDCEDGSSVILYEIVNGGHTWPGGPQYIPERFVGRTSTDINASETIWGFFKTTCIDSP